MSKKLIITAAITGAVHTPSLSPYLPYTPDQIVADAVGACQAGAAVVHIHGRHPETGEPNGDLKVMREVVSGIKAQCDAAICVTTGASTTMTVDERLEVIPALKPELASCNPGSMNFVYAPVAAKIKKPMYEWEIPYLEGSLDRIFANSFRSLERYITVMQENGTCPEFEVYDVGMINNIAYFISQGVIKKPVYLQFVMGILGGIPATVENLAYLVRTAKDQIGDFNWSVCGAGKAQLPMGAAAMAMGGNVRVGLEDNLYIRRGQLARSSGEQVTVVKEIAERLGLELATPDEARSMLQLKGKDKVAF